MRWRSGVTGFSSCDLHPSRTYPLVTPQLSSRRASGFVQTGYSESATRLLAAKRNHRVDRKGPTRGNQAGEGGDRNEQRRHGQDHDRIMRTIFDPATNDAVQSEAKRKTGGDAKANAGSGRERHDA